MAIEQQEAFISDHDELGTDSILDATNKDETPSSNKDLEFMEKYQIEDNVLYTIVISISQYTKIAMLTYMLAGGFTNKFKTIVTTLYAVIAITIVLLKGDGEQTTMSLAATGLSFAMTMLLMYYIGYVSDDDNEPELNLTDIERWGDSPNEKGEEYETGNEDDTENK